MCTTGLKRSMPCDDLISLKDAEFARMQAEANRFLEHSESMLLEQTENKRRCFGLESNRTSNSISTTSSDRILEKKKNPATAALEAALGMDEAMGFDTAAFDAECLHMTIYSSFAAESAALYSQDFFPFKRTYQTGASTHMIPSVDTVDNVAGILSKLTTAASTAA